jgi:hypothetical protein
MSIPDPNNRFLKVHDGDQWSCQKIMTSLNRIIDAKHTLLVEIYLRFRFFLNDATNILITTVIDTPNNQFHCDELLHRVQLYTTYHQNDQPDEIWSSLDKNFNRTEVEQTISQLIDLQINLRTSLGEVKNQLESKISNDPQMIYFFDKFLKHINRLIDNFNKQNDLILNSLSAIDIVENDA